MISNSTPACDTSDSRHAPRLASSLRAGMITETSGFPFVSVTGIVDRGRNPAVRELNAGNRALSSHRAGILYYIRVRPFSCSTRLSLVLILLAALPACYSGSRPLRIGSTAPEFTVQDSGRSVKLSDFRGQVIVLNFWATWCPPCVEEMPSLGVMQAALSDHVQVLAVSVDVDSGAYHKFLSDHDIHFLTVRDPEQHSTSLYGTHGFPETYIIDTRGIVRRKFIGPVNWTRPEMMEYLGSL